MIERLIELSARHRGIVIGLALALAIWGAWCVHQIPLDALPDLSNTQVIVYSHWDRSPDLIEDQVTYPIVTAMLGVPKVKAVRAVSDFGSSFIYVIFDDDTDLYWARTQTREYLSGILPNLPSGVTTNIGPDATGLGWILAVQHLALGILRKSACPAIPKIAQPRRLAIDTNVFTEDQCVANGIVVGRRVGPNFFKLSNVVHLGV